MHLLDYEQKARTHIFKRCREHLDLQGKRLGRPLTFDYRYEHTRTTAAIAGELAVPLGVDPALARITAWLHDIAKCWDPHLDDGENMARQEDHGQAGGEEAAVFLHSLGFPTDKTIQVKQAIVNHVGFIKDYILEAPLDALLWDADKLSKISGGGILHFLGAQLTLGKEVIDFPSFFLNIDRELHQGIRNSLNTEVARRWADAELEISARLQGDLLAAMEGKQPGQI